MTPFPILPGFPSRHLVCPNPRAPKNFAMAGIFSDFPVFPVIETPSPLMSENA